MLKLLRKREETRTAVHAIAVLTLIAVGSLAACGTDADPETAPDSPLTRWEADMERYLLAQAACLEEAGWVVQVDLAGRSLEIPDLPRDQQSVFADVKAGCDLELGEPPPPPSPDEAFIRDFYDQLVASKQCLEEAGYPVSDPPSFDAFRESWTSGPWSPYLDLAGTDWEDAIDACPQPG